MARSGTPHHARVLWRRRTFRRRDGTVAQHDARWPGDSLWSTIGAMGGDPDPEVHKVLRVLYWHDGQRRQIVVPEHGELQSAVSRQPGFGSRARQMRGATNRRHIKTSPSRSPFDMLEPEAPFPPLTLVEDGSKFAGSGESEGMAKTTRRVGVVLFQLGGPDTLAAIEPFLYNLFCDPDIIDFPFARIGRKPLAKLISTTRARKVQHHYATIGGGSPIRRFTEQQARALEAELAESRSGCPLLRGDALLASVYQRSHRATESGAMRRSCAAALVSAVFLNHDGIESERMAAPVPRQCSRAQRGSLLSASDVSGCGDRKD